MARSILITMEDLKRVEDKWLNDELVNFLFDFVFLGGGHGPRPEGGGRGAELRREARAVLRGDGGRLLLPQGGHAAPAALADRKLRRRRRRRRPSRMCASTFRGSAAAPKKAPKQLRVALPMGEDATLTRGALVYGMAGARAEERRRLIEVARELRGGDKGWAEAIEETINRDLISADAPLLSFGGGADDDLDLRRTDKGVARHAELVMDALDRLRARRSAAAAAAADRWCAGRSACRAACSGERSCTPTSTRRRRASSTREAGARQRAGRPLLVERAHERARCVTKNKKAKREWQRERGREK
jgi:hypothetical protein